MTIRKRLSDLERAAGRTNVPAYLALIHALLGEIEAGTATTVRWAVLLDISEPEAQSMIRRMTERRLEVLMMPSPLAESPEAL
jgi:hypothetical protein